MEPSESDIQPRSGPAPAYDELSRNLRSLARQLVREEATADDLVQEAWLSALDAPTNHVRDLNRWLRTVVINLARRNHRRSRRQREIEELASGSELQNDDDVLELKGMRNLLIDSVAGLNEPYCTVLTLRFFEGLEYDEIASRRDCTSATVRSQVKRGLNLLRDRLDRTHGGRRSEWVTALLPFAFAKKLPALDPSEYPSAPRSRGLQFFAGVGVVATLTLGLVAALVHSTTQKVPAVSIALTPEPEPGDRGRPTESMVMVPDSRPASGRSAPAADPSDIQVAPVRDDPVRYLTVAVLRQDGSPAIEGRVELFGRDHGAIPNPDDPGGLWYADLDGMVRIPLLEEQLQGDYTFREGTAGVMLSARDRDEAWTNVYRATVPPEGRTLEVHCRGPAQDLRVRLVDEAGARISGAAVILKGPRLGGSKEEDGAALPDSDAIVTTNSQGEFIFHGLPMREHRLTLRAPNKRPVDRILSSTDPLLDVTITVEDGLSVFGRVQLGDESPVNAARVWWIDQNVELIERRLTSTLTDPDGFFQLTGLNEGTHILFAEAAGDPTLFASTLLTVSQDTEAVWEPTLVPIAPLRIRVLDEQGAPVPEAIVVLSHRGPPFWGEIHEADSEGRTGFLQFPDLPLTLGAVRNGSDIAELRDGATDGIRRVPGEVEVYVKDSVTTASMTGTLTDSNGTPWPNASVAASRAVSGSVDALAQPQTGRFHFASLLPATYDLVVQVPGLGQHRIGEFELSENENLDIGEVRVPAPREISLHWNSNAPSTDAAWNLYVDRPAEKGPNRVRTLVSPVASIRLIPGAYVLKPQGKEQPATQFEVPKDGPVQPLEIR